jgi:hypothetical protein
MWHDLPPGPLRASAAIAGIDANLVSADASDFADFLRTVRPLPKQLPVLIELVGEPAGTSPAAIERLREELKRRGRGSLPHIYPSAPADGQPLRHCTALLSRAYCRAVLAGMADGSRASGAMIERFELQLPVLPQRARPLAEPAEAARPGPVVRPKAGRVLVGCIDSGCPFAHQHFRHADRGTRVLGLWDQDPDPAFRSAEAGGAMPPDLGYGCEITKARLDALMALCTRHGVVDEDACYELAGYDLLRRRLSHGAAVLDLMAGPLPFVARSSADPDRPPDWGKDDDDAPARGADIAFVQLPRDAVQDSSSAGLPRLLLDGLRWILSLAGEDTERIVVNLSDGSSRGSHDGQSMFERAMKALVAEQAALGRALQLVIAAGNSFDEQRHAQLDPAALRLEHRRAVLRVMPGSEAPSFVVARLPANTPNLRLRITPPSSREAYPTAADEADRPSIGLGQARCWPDADTAQCRVVMPAASAGHAPCALLAWPATAGADARARAAAAGDWTIEVERDAAITEPVHLYVTRNQTNPGAQRRGLQARFIDVDGCYDPKRYLRALEADPPLPASSIRRHGSLTSFATVNSGPQVTVVGAVLHREATQSLYSSEGPGLGDPPSRLGPDAYRPGDESRALRGVRAAGTRSGAKVRVTGTSFAAPQVARERANAPTSASAAPAAAGKAARGGRGSRRRPGPSSAG